MKNIVCDWKFEKDSVINGSLENGDIKIKDLSNKGNNLEMVYLGDKNNISKHINWSKDDEYIILKNNIKDKEGVFFKTQDNCEFNSLKFEDGYTIEVILELDEQHRDAWMGIITRDGMGKELGKTEGEVEILATLAYNDAFQWTHYSLNREDNLTNWSINATSTKTRKGFHHLAIVNDGKHTTMFLNGISDIRNPKQEIKGIKFVNGKGWYIGAGMWNNEITSLFSGTLKRIRICDKALEKEDWLLTNFEPTFCLKGSQQQRDIKPKNDNYTFAIIPDSQYMNQAKTDIVYKMMEWLAKNKENLNLQCVFHVGDISEEASDLEYENANNHFKILDEKNINYITTIGNHDYIDGGKNYEKYFTKERYKNKVGFEENSFYKLNKYFFIEVKNQKYLIISLDYKYLQDGIKWAKEIISKNKTIPTIILTHDSFDCLKGEMYKTENGEFLWENLISKENSIIMVLAGHEFSNGHRISKNDFGNGVIELLTNYQDYPSGGNGYLRILEIDEEKGIYGKTFSPWVNDIPLKERTSYDLLYLTSEKDEFFIPFNFNQRINNL